MIKPKLSENKKDWLKHAIAFSLVFILLGIVFVIRHKSLVGLPLFFVIFGLLIFTLALISPNKFARNFYRIGITLGFYIGSVVGYVFLVLLYIGVIIPIGFLMKLFGKDLLNTRRNYFIQSYWQPVKQQNNLENMY
jgi:surface polysaccharide O-acyltransferase-like enzyme